MMNCIHVEHTEHIQQLRDDYLHTLIAPMDGMWESAIIAQAHFWELQDQGQHVGYFCIGSDNALLRFHLQENYLVRAQEIFRWVVATYDIQQAITSTIEPLYFSLCLDFQMRVTPHSYLFRDGKRVDPLPDSGNRIFRKADKREVDDIVRFYRANVEGTGEWVEAFVNTRLNREELFVFSEQGALIATGECIPSQQQPPYADLGMVVARSQRGKGLGCSMLIRLKQRCYEAGWKPICSCAVENPASKRAIEKAGFISDQRIVKAFFSKNGD